LLHLLLELVDPDRQRVGQGLDAHLLGIVLEESQFRFRPTLDHSPLPSQAAREKRRIVGRPFAGVNAGVRAARPSRETGGSPCEFAPRFWPSWPWRRSPSRERSRRPSPTAPRRSAGRSPRFSPPTAPSRSPSPTGRRSGSSGPPTPRSAGFSRR